MDIVKGVDGIEKERLEKLNEKDIREGDHVLYWMQRSQRADHNHALEFSISKANEMNVPLLVLFCLTKDFENANLRHYQFMLEGLEETKERLEKRGVQLSIRQGHPETVVPEETQKASMLVTDKAYLDFLKDWRKKISKSIDIGMVEVESDVIVPVETASSKEEYAARTIRPKIHDKLKEFLVPLKKREVKISSLEIDLDSSSCDISSLITKIDIDSSVAPVEIYRGGTSEAEKHLKIFLDRKLEGYSKNSNDPSKDHLSDLSPYLHFGQISPSYVALETKKRKNEENEEDVEAFLEQLIIRRELAFNFVHYNDDYDSIECLPEWSKETLEKHKKDEREYVYSIDEFEEADTHDEYWNAAQKEMVKTGKMQGYMRMYWGKKILEWSETPERAYETALYLNDKYELDGRDPNGFAGVAWCFGKHDQGWKERDVYGKVRYMSAGGLERKFNIEEYVDKIEKIEV